MNTEQTLSLKNHFLIATPDLGEETIFTNSLIYLCDHNQDGAMGLIVNQPTSLTLKDIFEDLELDCTNAKVNEQVVHAGGPVESNKGFVLHLREKSSDGQDLWRSTMAVSKQVRLTTSTDIISALAQGKGPSASLMALGYAGWGPGQLEEELKQNAWLSVEATTAILFDTPAAKRAEAASKLLGIDLSLIGSLGRA